MEFIYLVVIILWILGIIIFKKNSTYALIPAFIFFLISASFAVFSLMDISEQIMRISFIGWIIGVLGSLIEYKKQGKIH